MRRDILVTDVVKTFPGGVTAVDHVSLEIAEGEFMVLVGPSGCGKTTLLRLIAGLEDVTAGQIAIADRDVTFTEPRDRDIAMVFQNYALYPHMSVRENLGYGLKVRGTERSAIARRVDEVARMLGLDQLMTRRPSKLSGGQRQRVAMGRAMAREPAAFLMDEPLSNLDAKLRVAMRAELSRLHNTVGVTTVYVTHDQVEAMTLGQRVAVMRDGVIQQVDRPQVLYNHPANLFVAAFIGSPAMNLVEARVEDDEVVFGGLRLRLPRDRRPPVADGESLILGVRPETFEDADFAPAGLPTFELHVDVVEELGSEAHVYFTLDAPRVESEQLRSASDGEEEVLLARERAVFNARVAPRSRARVGDRMRMAVDTARFQFFDKTTGVALTKRERIQ